MEFDNRINILTEATPSVVPGVEGADNNDYALVIRRWKNRGHDRSMNSAPSPRRLQSGNFVNIFKAEITPSPSQQANALNPSLVPSIIAVCTPACTCPYCTGIGHTQIYLG